MNVEIGTEAAPSPEKEYMNGIFVAIYPVPSDSSIAQDWQVWSYSRCIQNQSEKCE